MGTPFLSIDRSLQIPLSTRTNGALGGAADGGGAPDCGDGRGDQPAGLRALRPDGGGDRPGGGGDEGVGEDRAPARSQGGHGGDRERRRSSPWERQSPDWPLAGRGQSGVTGEEAARAGVLPGTRLLQSLRSFAMTLACAVLRDDGKERVMASEAKPSRSRHGSGPPPPFPPGKTAHSLLQTPHSLHHPRQMMLHLPQMTFHP